MLLIANLAITVASHLVAERYRGKILDTGSEPGPALIALYRGLVIGMIIGGPALWAVLHFAGVSSAVLWTETLELALFMVFWGFEIRRHWSVRPQSSAAAAA